jgi:Xaa-Pro aminopeptidase
MRPSWFDSLHLAWAVMTSASHASRPRATPLPSFEVDLAGCRVRQRRLIDQMLAQDVELAIVTRHEQVQWLTGARCSPLAEPAVALWPDGHCLLVFPNGPPERAAVDDVATYEGSWLATWRNDQRRASAQVLMKAIDDRPWPGRIGVEFSCCGHHIAESLAGDVVDIEPWLYRLRRRKEPDELALIGKAIAGTAAMYARAREVIRPGVTELEVYSQLQAAVTAEFGEPPTACGNDFQCGSPGGPPRDRAAATGELYILDLGPAFRGYFADNCRTIAVDGRPTDAQAAAWQRLMEVFPLVERTVKPGVRCRELYQEVKSLLDRYLPGGFTHHLGHGIGLNPHEAPHVNPHWDDAFEPGDVFTIEPGLYAPALAAGLRLENNYCVTEEGVELLSVIPMEL